MARWDSLEPSAATRTSGQRPLKEAPMDRELRTDAADMLAGVGRHWGWVLVFGIMEILLAFRLRQTGQAATRVAAAT
jgi:hypothetical protein